MEKAVEKGLLERKRLRICENSATDLIMIYLGKCQVSQQVIFFLAGMAIVGVLSMMWTTPPCYSYYLPSRVAILRDVHQRSHLPGSVKGIIGQSDPWPTSPGSRSGEATGDGIAHPPEPQDGEPNGEPAGIDEHKKEPRCVKRVHIFSDMRRMSWVPEMNHFRAILETSLRADFESDLACSSYGYDCDIKLTMGVKLHMLKGKDAVIFGMVATTWRRNNLLEDILKTDPEPGQTWIYYSTEPPFRVVRWTENLKIADFKYHVLMTYHRDSDIHIPFGYYRPFAGPEDGPTDTEFLHDEFYRNRTGLLSWVATNCDDVFWPRMPFINQLREQISIDDYGKCGRKECLPRRAPHCNKLFASYKFYLAIPNAECRDYITEKFWMISLKYGTVPLVLGTRREDYERVAPPHSYVHFGDFDSIKDVGDYLNRVDRDESLYREFHEWRKHGEIIITYPLHAEALCRTLPYIYPRNSSDIKYIGDSVWYNSCRTRPSNITVAHFYKYLDNWAPWR